MVADDIINGAPCSSSLGLTRDPYLNGNLNHVVDRSYCGFEEAGGLMYSAARAVATDHCAAALSLACSCSLIFR